jgi:biotin carboxyl carrier protein
MSKNELLAARSRVRGSGPILILAVLFVAATFLAWYFTWFGRGLSDADISKYLVDDKNPRHVQLALVQLQQRLERGDTGVKQWYPQLITLSKSQETEFRLTVAWLMGFDNQSEEFHQALLQLVHDPQPIVRRNAALALVRFNDHGGREEFLAILKPYRIVSPGSGRVASTLKQGSEIARGALVARVEQSDKVIEIRSPLPGKVNTITRGNGSTVATDEEILTLNSDEDSVWEALRALSIVGKPEDVEVVRNYASESSGKIKEQASLTVQSIQNRVKK